MLREITELSVMPEMGELLRGPGPCTDQLGLKGAAPRDQGL